MADGAADRADTGNKKYQGNPIDPRSRHVVVGRLDERIELLDGLPVAALLTELDSRTLVVANERLATLVESSSGDLLGIDVLTYFDPTDRELALRANRAMADKVIDGYKVERTIVVHGEKVTVDIWGRRVEVHGTLYGLWILVREHQDPTTITMNAVTAPIVLAFTDHAWRIEYADADADVLGVKGSELRDFPLLGLVHPSAAGEFLEAAARAAADHLAVTVLTRMRVGGDWADRQCLLTRMCEHQPPRLGVIISENKAAGLGGPQTNLDEQFRNSALEAQGVNVLQALPALARCPHGSELSARQCEIVARLVDGQTVQDIARLMFLSPSTVRNHLAATYRKFGVHSQAELLAALLRASTTP